MPDYGFRTGGAGGVQIDSTFQNLALRYTGSMTFSRLNVISFVASVSLACTENAVIAFRPTGTPCSMQDSSYANGIKTFRFWAFDAIDPVEYFIFDEPAFGLKVPGNYGRRNFNAQGVLTFDSRMKYMKVIGFQIGTKPPVGQSWDVNFTFPGISKIAVVQSSTFLESVFFPGDFDDPFAWAEAYDSLMMKVTEPNVLLSRQYSSSLYHQVGGYNSTPELTSRTHIILDVTGY